MGTRDYKREAERRDETSKRYHLRLPFYIAEPFDKKLKEDGLTFTDFVKNAIDKYLKNIRK